MTKGFYHLITALILSSCVATTNSSLAEKERNASFSEQYQSNIASLEQYGLFSYKVESYEPRLLVGYVGHFEWSNNCLAFISIDSNKKYTPIFPVQTTQVNNEGTTFTVSGVRFSIGEEVVLGGSFTNAADNQVTLLNRGDPECWLEETFTII